MVTHKLNIFCKKSIGYSASTVKSLPTLLLKYAAILLKAFTTHYRDRRSKVCYKNLFSHPFLPFSFLAGIAASITSGIVGSYVVVKRIVFISGSIAHSVLGGMGLFLWLKRTYDIAWINPLHGALLAAILSAFLIGWIHLRPSTARRYSDCGDLVDRHGPWSHLCLAHPWIQCRAHEFSLW